MTKLSEAIRVRLTKDEKERLFETARIKDVTVSDLVRGLINDYFYDPSEEEVEENLFIEKLKALKVITGLDIATCKKILIDSNGDTQTAIDQLYKLKDIKDDPINIHNAADTIQKIRFVFNRGVVTKLTSVNGDIRITDNDRFNSKFSKMNVMDIKFSDEREPQVAYIDIVAPSVYTKKSIYDTIVSYIDKMIRTSKSEISQTNYTHLTPIIRAQEAERALYDIICLIETNQIVASEIVKSYMAKINDLHNQYNGSIH